jgi:hypothetical protein
MRRARCETERGSRLAAMMRAQPASGGRARRASARRENESTRSGPLRLRLRVRLCRSRLDRSLAQGCRADGSEECALRARQLTDRRSRRQLARSLRRLVSDADSPRLTPFSPAVPVCTGAVVRWREGLLGLAERLEQEPPIDPCGIARAKTLVRDGSSPLYDPDAERSIGEMLWWIADGMQPCPPHAWGCPVVMKRDPERVAWTCALCGAIATSDDPDVRPA